MCFGNEKTVEFRKSLQRECVITRTNITSRISVWNPAPLEALALKIKCQESHSACCGRAENQSVPTSTFRVCEHE